MISQKFIVQRLLLLSQCWFELFLKTSLPKKLTETKRHATAAENSCQDQNHLHLHLFRSK